MAVRSQLRAGAWRGFDVSRDCLRRCAQFDARLRCGAVSVAISLDDLLAELLDLPSDRELLALPDDGEQMVENPRHKLRVSGHRQVFDYSRCVKVH